MSNFRQLYELHKQRRQEGAAMAKPGEIGGQGGRRKYKREVIVNADIFTREERDFLDWLLVKDEYYMDEVKELVRLEMERVVN